MPKNLRIFHHLRKDYYASLLLREKIVVFRIPSEKVSIHINDKMLSPDYFKELYTENRRNNPFYVPMTQHPLMYHRDLWDRHVPAKQRKNSVFMAGNFDPVAYRQFDEDNIFKLASRLTVFNYFKDKNLLFNVANREELNIFLQNKDDKKLILINRLIFDIPMFELRSMLASFNFYFALPGVVMPFSHNIIEAMSVETIPFIQEDYANMFKPALINDIHVITYKDLSDIEEGLNYLFTLSLEKISQMQKNISTYYDNYLTPQSLVDRIKNLSPDKIYLQAEHFSVELLKIAAFSTVKTAD